MSRPAPIASELAGSWLIGLAHFVIDAGLWRMRAEFPRSFLASRLPYLMRAETRA